MRRLKTIHSYHDGVIRSVEFGEGNSVVFAIELCGHSGSSGATHLSFYGVRNIEDVRNFIRVALEKVKTRKHGLEIIGLMRADGLRILMDLDVGPLYISAQGFCET